MSERWRDIEAGEVPDSGDSCWIVPDGQRFIMKACFAAPRSWWSDVLNESIRARHWLPIPELPED